MQRRKAGGRRKQQSGRKRHQGAPKTEPCQALATMRAEKAGKRSNRSEAAVLTSTVRMRAKSAARKVLGAMILRRFESSG